MALIEAAVAYHADQHQEADEIAALRRLVQRDLRNAGSGATRVAGQVKAFLEWIDDPKPAFADDGRDKFAQLIDLSRDYQDCTSFYISEVGVNQSTVWRWANGKSRPTKYIGRKLAHEVERRVAAILWQIASEEHLVG